MSNQDQQAKITSVAPITVKRGYVAGWPEIDQQACQGALLLVLVFFLLISIAYHAAITSPVSVAGLDFASFYHAAWRLNHSQPLYQPGIDRNLHGSLYVYSPLLALLLRPLALLSLPEATQLWFFVIAGCLALAVSLYASSLRLNMNDAPLIAILLIVSFRFWDSTMNFALGQANFIVLSLIAAIYWAESRNKPAVTVSMIVLASLIKIWLVGLILFLLLQRRWKASLITVAALAISLTALFTYIGWHEWPGYVRSMEENMAFVDEYAVQHSILGFARLHLRTNPIVDPILDNTAIYFTFVIACAVALICGLVEVWTAFNGGKTLQDRRRPSSSETQLCLGLIIASLMLALPTYENGYFVYCLPLLWTLCASGDTVSIVRCRQMLTIGVVIYLIFSRPWPAYAPFPPALQHAPRSLIVSMCFFGTVSLWAAMLYFLRTRPKPHGMAAPGVHSGLDEHSELAKRA